MEQHVDMTFQREIHIVSILKINIQLQNIIVVMKNQLVDLILNLKD